MNQQIAKAVMTCRKRCGLTQKELADLAGVGKTVVFDIERAKPTVRLDSVLKVLSALNIKLELTLPFQPEDQT